MRGGYETTGNYDAFCGIIARWNFGIVEAKDNTHSVGEGLQQAIKYAEMLDENVGDEHSNEQEN